MRHSLIIAFVIFSFGEKVKAASCSEGCITCDTSGIFSSCKKCQSGYYESMGYCNKCNWPCLSCTTYTCYSCASPFVNINGACVAQCKFPCKNCRTFPDFCTECVSGYKLDGSFCLKVPPASPPPLPTPAPVVTKIQPSVPSNSTYPNFCYCPLQ